MATLKTINGQRYIVEYYRDESGKRKAKYHATRTEDHDQAQEMLLAFNDTGESPHMAKERNRITVAEAFEGFLEYTSLHTRPASVSAYKRILTKPLRDAGVLDKAVNDVTTSDLLPVIQRADIKTVTQHNIKRHMKVFWNWMLREPQEYVKKNILLTIKLDKAEEPNYRKRMMTPEEFDRFYTLCSEDIGRPWLAPIVATYYYTGLRRSEALYIKGEHILEGGDLLYVEVTKDREPRMLPVPTPLKKILKAWVKSQDILPDEYLFRRVQENERLRPELISHVYSKKRKEARIPRGRTIHGMRHGAITRWITEGYRTEEAQLMAGHSDLNLTNRYTHLVPKNILKKMRALERN